MKGVILAAGDGTRLAPHTSRCPKVLLRVGDQAIIDFTLDAFAQVDVTNLAIVIGYRGEAVQQWVGDGSQWGLRVSYLFNPEYERGNAISVYAARPFVGDELFLLAMADHLVSVDLLSRLLETKDITDTLAVDLAPSLHQIKEATRVLVNSEGLVTRIAKGLYPWNGVDTGVFLLTPYIFDAIDELIREGRDKYELSEAISRLIERGHPLRACDVSRCFWQDIDTPEDLRLVRDMLARGEN